MRMDTSEKNIIIKEDAKDQAKWKIMNRKRDPGTTRENAKYMKKITI